jgi:hypothetical protein
VSTPLISKDTSKLPGASGGTNISVIVKHMSSTDPVTVIDGGSGKTVPLSEGGTATVGDVTVIDWPRYSAGTAEAASPYDRANAELNGIEFLCGTVDPESANFIRKHMLDYRLEITDSDLERMKVLFDNVDVYGQQLVDYVNDKLSKFSEQPKASSSAPFGKYRKKPGRVTG